MHPINCEFTRSFVSNRAIGVLSNLRVLHERDKSGIGAPC